jgi:glycosyltransferase involved in cell wall biosynthesis
MKILRVIHSTKPESGGPIESLTRRSEALVREGHTVEVVSLDSPAEASGRAFPFPLTALGKGAGRYGFNPALPLWIRRNAHRFDVVVLHGLWNFSSYGAWLGMRGIPTPYFIFTHGMMDPWFREQYPIRHIFKQMYWWLAEGRVLRDAERVLFTCEEERLRARNVFRSFSYNERVVRYGTSDHSGDPEEEREAFRSAFPELKDKRFLLFVGRIHPKKGCDLLIDAFAQCLRELPDDVDVVIAGPDQLGLMAGLKARAEKLGIAGRVHWPGMIKGSLKWGAYRCADAFILPSHQENFGIVVAEAMSCSTPVLISDKVNIWREVLEESAGIIAPDTLEGTASLIRRFYTLGAQERGALRLSARSGFENRFDIDQAISEIVSVFKLEDDRPPKPSNHKWRVLHVIHRTNPESGGPIESVVRTSEALQKAGHHVEVLSLDSKKELAARQFSFPVTGLGHGIGKFGFNWRLTPWLAQNAHRFDVVILHGIWNYTSVGAWRALHGRNVPYVVFTHGMLDPWFYQHYPIKGRLKRIYWTLFEGRVLRGAKRVLFTCEEEKLRARLRYRGFRYRERVVMFGTAEPPSNHEQQISAFREEFPRLNGRRFLLFLGRMHVKKGCDLLVKALAKSVGQIPDDVDLLIVGPDEAGIVPTLREMAARGGVEERVHFQGMLMGDAKWGALRACEALILPSHQENFGIVVAEAMACAKPVLISNKVNIWREVGNAGAGLVEEDTLEGACSLIQGFYGMDEDGRQALGAAGRKLFLESLEIGGTAEDLARLFEEIQPIPQGEV